MPERVRRTYKRKLEAEDLEGAQKILDQYGSDVEGDGFDEDESDEESVVLK